MDNAMLLTFSIPTILTAATLWVYALQLKAMRKDLSMQNLANIFDRLQTSEAREARHHLYNTLADTPFDKWTEEDRRQASIVYNSYDLAGLLIQQNMAPKEIIIKNWGASAQKCMKILSPFLEDLKLRMPLTNYGAHMAWICNEVRKLGINAN